MNKSTKTWIENRRVNKYWFWKLTEAIVLVAVQIKFLFGNEHIYIVNLPIRLFVLNFYKLSVMKIQISPIYLNSILMYKTDFSSSSNYAWYGINDPFCFYLCPFFRHVGITSFFFHIRYSQELCGIKKVISKT